MPSLGRMLVQRDVVQADLSTIRTDFSELHIGAASVAKVAVEWSRGCIIACPASERSRWRVNTRI